MSKTEQESYETQEVISTLNQTAVKSEKFFEKHAKNIGLGFGALVLFALGYVAYQNFIVNPKNDEAAIDFTQAQKLFNEEKYDAAVGGKSGSASGFAEISEEYSGTQAGKLAAFYAGISKFKLGKYQEALDYLEKFNTSDKDLEAVKYGAMGDAYAELNNDEKALEYLEKASKASDKSATVIQFSKKAAIFAMATKQNEKALEILKQVNEKFPDADSSGEIEAYIEQLTYATNGK